MAFYFPVIIEITAAFSGSRSTFDKSRKKLPAPPDPVAYAFGLCEFQATVF